jgi:hypothetical protein
MQLLQDRGVPVKDADSMTELDFSKVNFATVWNPPAGLLDKVQVVLSASGTNSCWKSEAGACCGMFRMLETTACLQQLACDVCFSTSSVTALQQLL